MNILPSLALELIVVLMPKLFSNLNFSGIPGAYGIIEVPFRLLFWFVIFIRF